MKSNIVKHHFTIADNLVCIDFLEEDEKTGMHILPSFEPFRVIEAEEDGDMPDSDADTVDAAVMSGVRTAAPMLHFTVDLNLRPLPKDNRQRIRTFDTGNGNTIVDRLCDGGYQFVIRDVFGKDCALLISNADFSQCRCNITGTGNMRRFGLNNALMLAYAYAASFHNTLFIHASLVRHRGKGYAFTAKSGTGKSTQVANWLKTIPDCDLMNDDNPIICIIDGKAFIYGSPWSGKTPCYRHVCAPLGAVTKISRAMDNRVERLSPLAAFGIILPSCAAMKWDHTLYSRICDTVTALVSAVPVYVLHCTASPESAIVCQKAIAHDD